MSKTPGQIGIRPSSKTGPSPIRQRALLAAIAIGLGVATQLATARWFRRPLASAVLVPFGTVVLLFAALRSMALTVARGGVDSRGTRYPIDVLRRGRRYVMA